MKMKAKNATAGTNSSAQCKEIAVLRELFTKQPCQTTKHILATQVKKSQSLHTFFHIFMLCYLDYFETIQYVSKVLIQGSNNYFN